MLNLKDINKSDIKNLLYNVLDYIDLVRIATDPKDIKKAIEIGEEVKKMGIEFCINMMYLSKITDTELERTVEIISNNHSCLDYLCLVDSYGGLLPSRLQEIIKFTKDRVKHEIGFHGHNNLELALSNSLLAIESGASIVDCTIMGMGRGAGNLKTELILIHLENIGKISLDYNRLGQLVELLNPLWERYRWGTNMPYMISGAKSLPQQGIMSWLAKKRYSIEDIVVALQNFTNKKKEIKDKLDIFCAKDVSARRALIIGGGDSIEKHKEAIEHFLIQNRDILLIYSTTHHLEYFNHLENDKILCLMGNESIRLDDFLY